MVLALHAPGSSTNLRFPSSVMDSHSDHIGQGASQRPHSPSHNNRHMMMPPYSNLATQSQYQTAEIPSTNKPSPAPVTTASLYPPEGASSNRRSVSENAGVHLQTSPLTLNGGSSPDSHAGSAGYTWTSNDPWSASRSPQQQYGGNRTPGGLNPGSFFQHGMHSLSTTMASNLSPVTATTPADTHASFHSSPATTMSHLSIDQSAPNGSSNGILPPFRGNSNSYSARPTPPLSRSSSFPAPASTLSAFVPGISSMLPMSTMASSRPGLAAPISPLGSSTGAPPPPPPGPGRLSDYTATGHHHHHQQQPPQPQQYMHNLGNPGGPMALVSHYPPVGGAYGGHFGGMMFQAQQRTPEKPHQCDQCPTAFTRNHDLKRHKRIHWAVKPYPCDGCDKAFSRKDALKRHKLVKCCGEKDDKSKKEGSPASAGTQDIHSGSSSPVDARRHMM
ncbi:hypothetical protein BD289DRAFT_170287 [Coniella lustricola]|uniref:C2H2-type domain-containing protein n=1 Tax=Coniella lustricola TaxID=2025994 RepID=A0A2T3ADZ5_9PEZI|nr:hypothetical protein BD289DRAFT_170287 [Coniella lustricola]